MPRLMNRVPKYSLHKASGQARVKYNGRVKYLGVYGTQASKEAYAAFIAQLPKHDGPATTTVAIAEPAPG